MTATAYSSAPLPPDATRAPRGEAVVTAIGDTPLLPLDVLLVLFAAPGVLADCACTGAVKLGCKPWMFICPSFPDVFRL